MAFDGGKAIEPSIDITQLHAKIEQLALENGFLEGALSEAGLLSVKR
jgi:transposase